MFVIKKVRATVGFKKLAQIPTAVTVPSRKFSKPNRNEKIALKNKDVMEKTSKVVAEIGIHFGLKLIFRK